MILASRKTLNEMRFNTCNSYRTCEEYKNRKGEGRPVTTLDNTEYVESNQAVNAALDGLFAKSSWRSEIVEEEIEKDEIPEYMKAPRCDCAVYTGCFFDVQGTRVTGFNLFTCDTHERQYLEKRGEQNAE